MLERIATFFRDLNGGAPHRGEGAFARDDPRLAAAALIYHVMSADGVVQQTERERFAAILGETYSLDTETLDRLIVAARDADDEAVDLYQFTSVLMRNLEAGERVHFIELLWEIVYSDGENHELEDNLVWRISELLGVDGRERVLLRQAVEARQSDSDGAGE